MEDIQDLKMLRIADVVSLTGLAKTTIYEAMRRGDFPKNYKLSALIVGWKQSDIKEWLTTRIKKQHREKHE